MKNTALFFALLLCFCGCIERRIRITSDPPQATVLVDGKTMGRTPVEMPFHFYGTREVTLIKDGYHVFTHLQSVEAPLYSQFPFDFLVEVLYPFTIVENHDFSYTLKPHVPWNRRQKEELLKRAETLRQKNR